MASIKQNLAGQPLPDFRNSGVMLRILLGVNLLALLAALVESDGVSDSLRRYIDMAAWVQPLLLFNVALLGLLGKLLRRAPTWLGRAAVVFLAAVSAILLSLLWRSLALDDGNGQRLVRAGLLGAAAAGIMLAYFALRVSALSPALVEARLQALTARIRPHFLFNSLNAVLSLIRVDPRRAETALEELAELFRALMRDHRELVPLADELALCRQYLDLEKLRLAERLNVEWELAADLPLALKVPPLMVQPLLENAVYHGIEPAADGGTIRIGLTRRGDELHVDLVNPCGDGVERPRGNHMALDNIRERLALYYDLEARLETGEVRRLDGRREYRVRIVLPCHADSP
ncbi:MAG: histidine kinase [Candidatus Accumulibacter sp.]|uniref:sensor histidine kinase n=1 Tax=Accumulibacter sp. TaxID=2053492 RepID=UPI001A0F6763|nr:histidine kinase [Accumulibacter sp.]MBE2260203.1 histidine kinase [Paracoccaceae bacterium]MCB1943398.1 histidine kinase [Accumulibacter sp.]MCP5247481.1 histidine kinase [Accumulibacter sp.]